LLSAAYPSVSHSPAKHSHHPVAADAVKWLASGSAAFQRMMTLRGR
jgi:hypothetical protein